MRLKATKRSDLFRQNASCAKATWPEQCTKPTLAALRELTIRFGFSVSLGEVRLLDGRWYVTNSGLLGLATRRRCRGISARVEPQFSDVTADRWVFRATVHKSGSSRGFVGFGDAEPSNVSALVRGAEMRVAETRAVNRALRKAYGIGLCSVEELGAFAPPPQTPRPAPAPSIPTNGNGSGHSEPRLRDRLCLLIRQHNLDPTLVKAFAADFCGTATLKEAGRDLVESFISHIATAAKEDRDALVCKLNSYAQPVEVKP
jgi:hypothetical protein